MTPTLSLSTEITIVGLESTSYIYIFYSLLTLFFPLAILLELSKKFCISIALSLSCNISFKYF